MSKYAVFVNNAAGVKGCWISDTSQDTAEMAAITAAHTIADGKGFVLYDASNSSKLSVPAKYASEHAWRISIFNQDTHEEV